MMSELEGFERLTEVEKQINKMSEVNTVIL